MLESYLIYQFIRNIISYKLNPISSRRSIRNWSQQVKSAGLLIRPMIFERCAPSGIKAQMEGSFIMIKTTCWGSRLARCVVRRPQNQAVTVSALRFGQQSRLFNFMTQKIWMFPFPALQCLAWNPAPVFVSNRSVRRIAPTAPIFQIQCSGQGKFIGKSRNIGSAKFNFRLFGTAFRIIPLLSR